MRLNEAFKINNSLNKCMRATASTNLVVEMGMDTMMDYEPDEEGTDNEDLGLELGLDDALLDAEDSDMVDEFLNSVIDLVAQEYEEDSAIDAVDDAISSLVDDGSIDDIPSADEPDDVKSQWIFNSLAKIKDRLHDLGLEFDETDLEFYDTYSAAGQ